MKNIGIVVNKLKDNDFIYTKKLYDWILAKGCCPIVTESTARGIQVCCAAANDEDLCEKSDFIVVLGGDGTVLQVAREAAIYDTPILGINLGTLGFLTDVDKLEGIGALETVLAGKYKTERRMMLEAHIKDDKSAGCLIALNEVCVLRGSLLKMLKVDVRVNDQYLETYRADGIIVSTPTGSTAYNMSAGGPILKPDIELIAITPICPHQMNARSCVVSSRDEVTVIIDEGMGDDIVMAIDGQEHIPLKPGQQVTIKKSGYYTTVIKTNHLGFYDILRLKLDH